MKPLWQQARDDFKAYYGKDYQLWLGLGWWLTWLKKKEKEMLIQAKKEAKRYARNHQRIT